MWVGVERLTTSGFTVGVERLTTCGFTVGVERLPTCGLVLKDLLHVGWC